MKKTTIAWIGKLLIIVGMILLLAIFPGSVILSYLVVDAMMYDIIFKGILVAFFVVGGLVLIFMKYAGDTLRTKTKNDQ